MRLSRRRIGPGWLAGALVLAAAFGLALVSARDYAGGWNDGSRLAETESLVDYHTFAIDRSIFVHVPHAAGATPYGDNPLLNRFGTRDVILVGGKIYSSKPPVPSLLMAPVYAAVQYTAGLTARRNPRRFCFWMTVLTSGVAYAVAVWCAFAIALRTGLERTRSVALAASLALATVAIAYMQAVNDHIVVLAVVSALILNMLGLVSAQRAGKSAAAAIVLIGALSGLGYALEQGGGTILLVSAAAWAAYRTRSWRLVSLFVLAAAPFLAVHHLITFAIGHTLWPANSVPAYVAFPGAAFTPASMSGLWVQRSMLKTIGYGLGLLFGPRGFIGYNLPLYLALIAICVLIARRDEQLPEVVFAGCYAGGTWIAYALLSSNYSGECCSIRWFVPLLAPGYYILARFLKQQPEYWPDFLILSGWGILLGARLWWQGPWSAHFGIFFFPLQAAGLISWAAYRVPRLGWGRSQLSVDRPRPA